MVYRDGYRDTCASGLVSGPDIVAPTADGVATHAYSTLDGASVVNPKSTSRPRTFRRSLTSHEYSIGTVPTTVGSQAAAGRHIFGNSGQFQERTHSSRRLPNAQFDQRKKENICMESHFNYIKLMFYLNIYGVKQFYYNL